MCCCDSNEGLCVDITVCDSMVRYDVIVKGKDAGFRDARCDVRGSEYVVDTMSMGI